MVVNPMTSILLDSPRGLPEDWSIAGFSESPRVTGPGPARSLGRPSPAWQCVHHARPHNRWGSHITLRTRPTTKAMIQRLLRSYYTISPSHVHISGPIQLLKLLIMEPLGPWFAPCVRNLTTGGACIPQLENSRLEVRSGFNSMGRAICKYGPQLSFNLPSTSN